MQIAIIGAGQIGSRHLQALSNLTQDNCDIHIVDISQESLNVALERFYLMPKAKEFKGTLNKHTSITDLPSKLDFAFITTTANVRRSLMQVLLESKSVEYLVLEKVLFQNVRDLGEMGSLISSTNTTTFVNFPRRQYPIYQEAKSLLSNSKSISMSMTGANWGLACNGLHIIDLFLFLTGCMEIDLSFQQLSKDVIQSKRSNFLEVSGTITGTDEVGNSLSITCYEAGTSPSQIVIQSNNVRITVLESGPDRRVTIATEARAWVPENSEFVPLYQSQLSHLIVNSLLNSQTCDLIEYHSAIQPHQQFLEGLLKHFNANTNENYTSCPIT